MDSSQSKNWIIFFLEMLQIKAVETTSSISLHVGRSISDITLSQITAHNCRTGYYADLKITLFEKDSFLTKLYFKSLCYKILKI